eukprot:364577-Chlamydomonas_euryale.AAC.20
MPLAPAMLRTPNFARLCAITASCRISAPSSLAPRHPAVAVSSSSVLGSCPSVSDSNASPALPLAVAPRGSRYAVSCASSLAKSDQLHPARPVPRPPCPHSPRPCVAVCSAGASPWP